MRTVWNLDDAEATRLIDEEHLSITETARRLGVSRQAIYHAIRKGRVPQPGGPLGKRSMPLDGTRDESACAGTDRPSLIRLRTMDGSPRYRHGNGWYIQRHKRDYSERGGMQGYRRAPLFWWSVTSPRDAKGALGLPEHFFAPTLRECRAWCDEHNSSKTPIPG